MRIIQLTTMRSMLIKSIFVLSIYSFGCSAKKQADLLVYNATIYTVDYSFSTAEAIAVKDGKILAIGKSDELQRLYEAKEKVDAQQKFIFPGFIDAHAHFLSYGLGLQEANLVGTNSWDEILDTLKK